MTNINTIVLALVMRLAANWIENEMKIISDRAAGFYSGFPC